MTALRDTGSARTSHGQRLLNFPTLFPSFSVTKTFVTSSAKRSILIVAGSVAVAATPVYCDVLASSNFFYSLSLSIVFFMMIHQPICFRHFFVAEGIYFQGLSHSGSSLLHVFVDLPDLGVGSCLLHCCGQRALPSFWRPPSLPSIDCCVSPAAAPRRLPVTPFCTTHTYPLGSLRLVEPPPYPSLFALPLIRRPPRTLGSPCFAHAVVPETSRPLLPWLRPAFSFLVVPTPSNSCNLSIVFFVHLTARSGSRAFHYSAPIGRSSRRIRHSAVPDQAPVPPFLHYLSPSLHVQASAISNGVADGDVEGAAHIAKAEPSWSRVSVLLSTLSSTTSDVQPRSRNNTGLPRP